MTCRRCPEGRRYAPGSVYCRIYGMILTEGHECRRRAGKQHEEAGEYRVEDTAVMMQRCRELYQNPENERAYQEWKANRDAKTAKAVSA